MSVRLERGAGVLVLAAAALLPWSTWWAPWGMSAFVAVTHTPLTLFAIAALLVLAAFVMANDAWLGAFVGYAAIAVVWTPPPARPLLTAQLIVYGAVALLVVRALPARWIQRGTLALCVAGVGQTAYALMQRRGVDVFWPGGPHLTTHAMPGTVGNSNWLGTMLALLVALTLTLPAPRRRVAWWLQTWVLPAALTLGIVLAGHRFGLVAVAIAFYVRVRYSLRWEPVAGVGLAIAGLALVHGGWGLPYTVGARLEGWWVGARLWWTNAPVLGLGPGSWRFYMPHLAPVDGTFIGGDLMDAKQFFGADAHFEVLELAFAFGLVGLTCLGGWLWSHRHALLASPPFAALVVLTCGGSPFHVAQVAATALVVLAVATIPKREEVMRMAEVNDVIDGTGEHEGKKVKVLAVDGDGTPTEVEEVVPEQAP